MKRVTFIDSRGAGFASPAADPLNGVETVATVDLLRGLIAQRYAFDDVTVAPALAVVVWNGGRVAYTGSVDGVTVFVEIAPFDGYAAPTLPPIRGAK